MSSINKKISLRQAMLLFLFPMISATIALVPSLANESAKQAAWISPFISIILFGLFLFVLQSFYKKYKEVSLIDIFGDIIGKIFGKIVFILYFAWITINCASYFRFFTERLTMSTFSNTNTWVLIVALIILSSFILRGGLEVLARLNEVLFTIVFLFLIIVFILIFPQFKIANYFPLTYKDALPVLCGNVSIIATWAFFIVILMFSDKITNMDKIKKMGFKAILIMGVLTLIIIIIPLGMYGASYLSVLTMPFFSAIRQISLFNIIERIEGSIISLWILSDFMLLCIFAYSALHILKKVFSLSQIKSLINIYLIGIIIISLLMCRNVLEFVIYCDKICCPVNLFFGYLIPLIVFIIGKIRKKI